MLSLFKLIFTVITLQKLFHFLFHSILRAAFLQLFVVVVVVVESIRSLCARGRQRERDIVRVVVLTGAVDYAIVESYFPSGFGIFVS